MARKPKTPGAEKQGTSGAKATETATGTAGAPAQISKLARLKVMLASPEGASIAEIGATLAWQPHTVRAALSSLRKAGATIERIAPEAKGEAARYRLVAGTEGSE
ncbi:DUF3489 domain-containing protein [Rhodobacter sp. HX-7-19]|uniref:DUF3489 domain-containing protein n=1 Tax=Paragemmobacter kunshanensis TaxID=2583234 RepID=A0A6M1UAV1_9RHOB|nr:DUF3489 domain-containing protein [Rhodobacter kunshanensis]NGQ93153.1 DUF3489 domain-containing protein [Rhodobacter kunshanensis]